MTFSVMAEIRVVWDAYYCSRYWVLSGTHSVLDGTVMAVQADRLTFEEQARLSLATLNARRRELGLPTIRVSGL